MMLTPKESRQVAAKWLCREVGGYENSIVSKWVDDGVMYASEPWIEPYVSLASLIHSVDFVARIDERTICEREDAEKRGRDEERAKQPKTDNRTDYQHDDCG